MKTQTQKPPKTPFVVLSFGGAWEQLFEDSMLRKFLGFHHIRLGSPNYQMSEGLFRYTARHLTNETEDSLKGLFARVNSKSTQASEILFRLDWMVMSSNILLLDSRLLDTAIGQHLLHRAHEGNLPAYGIATDHRSSPLAAAYLKATLYPASPDDLLKVCLSHQPKPEKK